ncbi:hypothetical protein Taro_003812 [Colocasia esculenta]|uniref:DYW domain-containing protein n=1 Tax=Colocasia esculenta TaxID=4460 RepID=A0A843TGG2_COLES|nr:hypothetical protein [Colocasia esculenta]
MRCHCVRPDLYTFPFLLQPLSSPSHLPFGRLLHAHTLLFGLLSDTLWHGRSQECLALFDQMLSRSVTPNAVTFLGVLCTCVHGGLVEEGKEYFDRMSLEFGIAPLIQHYGCIVDLYGRAGMINQAWERSLHGDRETCELALKNLIELEPLNSGAHVLLSNLYAKMGRWADVRRVRGLMEAKGVKKTPGCAMVEIGGDLYEFLVGDRTHPETRDTYLMLEEIMRRLKAAGYVANTGEVLLDLDKEPKEAALAVHSEKLAIVFCFIRTAPGTALRVVKNLRVCVDCHTAIKLISEIYEREIVVRDCSRFHHFRHGSCSCADFCNFHSLEFGCGIVSFPTVYDICVQRIFSSPLIWGKIGEAFDASGLLLSGVR